MGSPTGAVMLELKDCSILRAAQLLDCSCCAWSQTTLRAARCSEITLQARPGVRPLIRRNASKRAMPHLMKIGISHPSSRTYRENENRGRSGVVAGNSSRWFGKAHGWHKNIRFVRFARMVVPLNWLKSGASTFPLPVGTKAANSRP